MQFSYFWKSTALTAKFHVSVATKIGSLIFEMARAGGIVNESFNFKNVSYISSE